MTTKVPGGFKPVGDWPELPGRQPSEFVQKRTLLPRACLLRGKTIWPFQKAWCKVFYHDYTREPAFEQWICNEEMLFAKIKGRNL